MLLSGASWMSDFGDDYEEYFDEVLNVFKGMIENGKSPLILIGYTGSSVLSGLISDWDSKDILTLAAFHHSFQDI